MRAKYTRVRLRVIGPFLVYLLVFLLWYPYWQHDPHSPLARLLGVVFAAMTLVLAALCIVGGFFAPFGRLSIVGDILKLAIGLYETYIAKDSDEPKAHARGSFSPATCPALEITKRLKDGTPVRGACPVCEEEFSTEAFDSDRTYPHATTLERWYEEHFVSHLEES